MKKEGKSQYFLRTGESRSRLSRCSLQNKYSSLERESNPDPRLDPLTLATGPISRTNNPNTFSIQGKAKTCLRHKMDRLQFREQAVSHVLGSWCA
jgi:hypothetical protein